jgi:hypothetical protein
MMTKTHMNFPQHPRQSVPNDCTNDYLPVPLPLRIIVLSGARYLHGNGAVEQRLMSGSSTISPSIRPRPYRLNVDQFLRPPRSSKFIDAPPLTTSAALSPHQVVSTLLELFKVAAWRHRRLESGLGMSHARNLRRPLGGYSERPYIDVDLDNNGLRHLVERVGPRGIARRHPANARLRLSSQFPDFTRDHSDVLR